MITRSPGLAWATNAASATFDFGPLAARYTDLNGTTRLKVLGPFFEQASAEDGMARAAARSGADRYERMGAAFHARVRAGFLAIAAAEPGRCAVVDAAGSPDAVFAEISAALRARLGVVL